MNKITGVSYRDNGENNETKRSRVVSVTESVQKNHVFRRLRSDRSYVASLTAGGWLFQARLVATGKHQRPPISHVCIGGDTDYVS